MKNSIFLLLLFSCSKNSTSTSSNTPKPVLESFTYTVTDSTGEKHSFSDTTIVSIDKASGNTVYTVNGTLQGEVAAYITPSGYNNTRKFYFDDFRSLAKTQVNKLVFYLPWYTDNLSAGTGLQNAKLIIALPNPPEDNYDYNSTGDYFDDGFIDVKINLLEVKTEISDSTGGYITGSFNFTAETESKKPILVMGIFNHIPTNYQP
jgi:ABC-type Fe3+-hydroxamate transport system substrate-binding protein